jgi:predicted flap endonuclease-1-like 5' DNA nuclease
MRASARSLAAETETTGYIWNGEPVDDFEPIKGIGKVYEQRLYSAGIRTYTALAKHHPERFWRSYRRGRRSRRMWQAGSQRRWRWPHKRMNSVKGI